MQNKTYQKRRHTTVHWQRSLGDQTFLAVRFLKCERERTEMMRKQEGECLETLQKETY